MKEILLIISQFLFTPPTENWKLFIKCICGHLKVIQGYHMDSGIYEEKRITATYVFAALGSQFVTA